jgi:hypothetical protein
MGFVCSQLSCNIYFLFYQCWFIMKLAKWSRIYIMGNFKYSTRYMDDICWINVGDPNFFLGPHDPRMDDNPFRVYPLKIVQIKPQVIKYDANFLSKNIKANFMNLHICRNPSLGLATKARGCKVVGQEKSPGPMSHAPGSAKECERIDPHTPKGTPPLGIRVSVDSRIFKGRVQGPKLNGLKSSLYHWKALET